MDGENRRKTDALSQGASIPFLLWILFFISLLGGSYYWLYWVPTPLGVETEAGKFSEERALNHIRVLSEEIGFRQVSSPGLKVAADYLTSEVRKLAEFANSNRSDLDAEIDIERVSGSIVDHIFGHEIINIYHNLTNIILHISPKTSTGNKAFLINAHFDSALGSPGAADCGSCVGVALETIRSLIEGGHPFHSPLVLLLNGGEETFLQAAHGFMTQSKWRHKIGAFVNLESTGSGGAALLFQYSTPWALEAYQKGAIHPRGMVLAQEFFESGMIPADTDFRMFSLDHSGAYPGIDIATVMDATAYHTDRDTVARLRPGGTQEYGETVLGLTKSFMEQMSNNVDTKKVKMVYIDCFHKLFVVFQLQSAYWSYHIPIGVLLVALDRSLNKMEFLSSTGLGLMRNLVSCVLAVVLPGLAGALRVLLSGRPMVWFGHHFVGFMFFWPTAVFGYLLPMKCKLNQNQISGSFAGISLLLTTFALYLSNAGSGSSLIPFILSLTTSLLSLVTQFIQKQNWVLLMIGWFPSTACAALSLIMVRHIMEKVSMAGSRVGAIQQLVPDFIIGLLNGILILLTLQSVSPLLTANWTERIKSKFLKLLLLIIVIIGIGISFVFPYTIHRPKRLYLNHLCRQKTDLSCEFVWALAWSDAVDISEALPPEFRKLTPHSIARPGDWISLAPFNKVVKGVVFPGPPMTGEGPWGHWHPYLKLNRIISNSERGTKTIFLDLNWDHPGWGAMNISGPILDWSLSENNGIRKDKWNIVRFAQDVHEPIWSFWIELEATGELDLELGIYYVDVNPETLKLKKQFPQWTAVTAGTSFVCKYNFK
eukprot:g8469.t1